MPFSGRSAVPQGLVAADAVSLKAANGAKFNARRSVRREPFDEAVHLEVPAGLHSVPR